ncbi:LytR/AlgR family response regulator transcription factor [Hanstruepera ponticola]|uniref:LytR/AlgR family response regulator transcription factor n=1 Tax=Hanstruepera ponticola TaxID=2042995 RepID=UPI001CA9D363|nr:LytTR family DNA-binding domain-containing protein [Hanstruepera ponticola]
MKITTLIIDDEPLARQRIRNLLTDIVEIEILDECATGKKAIKAIESNKPDLIFLDIQLKDMTGFNVLEKIDNALKPIVVFITAYNEYALKAFEFFAFDYLQKPFKDDRFFTSTKKAIEQVKQRNNLKFEDKIEGLLNFVYSRNEKQNKTTKFPIKLGNKVVFIDSSEIKYIIASGYYAEIHTENKKHLLRESLNNLTEELNASKFVRIHRSTIINLDFIKELIHSNYGEIDVKMNDNNLFRISRSFKKEFLNKMGL